MNLPYDPAIPLQGTYPGKTIILKDTCTPVFTAALFTIVRAWKQCRYSSTDEWIKMWCIYIYMHTPWTTAHQAPPPWDFPGKSTGVGYHCLLCMEYYTAIKRTNLSQF